MAIPGSLASLQPAGDDEIPRKIRDLERRQDEMGPSVARSFGPVILDLQAKQAALDAANAELAAQLVSINGLIAAQTAFDGNTSNTDTGVIPSGGYADAVSLTLAAPAWATRAAVTASAVMWTTSNGGPAGIFGRIVIAGAAGGDFEYVAQASGEPILVTPLHFRSFDPGTSIVVQAQWQRTVGDTFTGHARLVATALYLR